MVCAVTPGCVNGCNVLMLAAMSAFQQDLGRNLRNALAAPGGFECFHGSDRTQSRIRCDRTESGRTVGGKRSSHSELG